MPAPLTFLCVGLAAVGVLLMTYVQAGIIRNEGFRAFRAKGFVQIYWRERTPLERACFFAGLAFLLTPFVLFGTTVPGGDLR